MRIFSNDVYGFMPLRTIWSSEGNIISFFFLKQFFKQFFRLLVSLSFDF